VFVHHTYIALQNDDTETIKDAGITGIILSLSAVVVQRLHKPVYTRKSDDIVLILSFLLLVGVSAYAVIDRFILDTDVKEVKK
jgi:hypothetical protein